MQGWPVLALAKIGGVGVNNQKISDVNFDEPQIIKAGKRSWVKIV